MPFSIIYNRRKFISEEKRIEDLIRHNKFVSVAQARGVNASDKHVLFPIPQSEIDANTAIRQTTSY